MHIQYIVIYPSTGVEYTPRSDMWTSLLTLASVALLAQSYQDFVPVRYPPITTTIVCMIPGPYENGKKRTVSSPDRIPIPEPVLRLSLIPPRTDEECWTVPEIVVKQPDLPTDPTALMNLYRILDDFLRPPNQARAIAHNVQGALVPTDPNTVYNITLPQYQIPDKFLAPFSASEQVTIRQYAAALGIGQCNLNPKVMTRPDFYFPRFQVQGTCRSPMNMCSLPMTNDHEFSQMCRADIGGDDQIYIQALRWDCCHSFTNEQDWENICGWRRVEFPVVHKCECSCDPSEQ